MRAEEFARKIFEKTSWPRDEMCPPPLEAQEGLNILIDHFLGKDWYVVMPIGTKQVNTEAVYEILRSYPEKKRVRRFFQKLFCRHDWVETDSMLVDVGRNKVFWLECRKCGKRTITTLDGRKKFERKRSNA